MSPDDRVRLERLRRQSRRKLFGGETDVAFLLRLLDEPRDKFGRVMLTAADLDAERERYRLKHAPQRGGS